MTKSYDDTDDGYVKAPEPPARQRVVQLFDTVPSMARCIGASDFVDLFFVIAAHDCSSSFLDDACAVLRAG